MPTYEYRCPTCQKREDHQHKMNETFTAICLNCFEKGKPSDMIKGPGGGIGIHFKGTGFYQTDYKGK